MIATRLTILRIFIAPLFAYTFFAYPATALLLVIVSEASDIADGILARRKGESSDFGKLLDPMADQIARLTVFLCFLSINIAPLWTVLCILWRDIMVSFLRLLSAKEGVVISARMSGKIKALFQGSGIIFIMALIVSDSYLEIIEYVMGAVAVVTVWSGVDYLWSFLKR
jgi:CDP-diacylglycerol--glycerol-3-phosphate 3-phosphatidyltransferase